MKYFELNSSLLDGSPKPQFHKVSTMPNTETKKRGSVHKFYEEASPILEVLFAISLVLLVQFCLAVGSYSGEGAPPMHGDFEAQRHWMEITYHLPASQWYVNSTDNDLLYWGLDYPPLTAYHSYLMGALSNLLNPAWVELNTSHGIETTNHKLFMRISAILPVLFIYLPAIAYYVYALSTSNLFKGDKKAAPMMTRVNLFTVLILYPGLLVIDNAHFQYNSVSLGLFVWSYCLLATDRTLLGSTAFVLALNYKQMELYHALPIFVFILSRALRRPTFFSKLGQIAKVGAVVSTMFVILWLPFLCNGTAIDVLRRVFPFHRGAYEDKVASVWCAFSFVFKRLPDLFQRWHIFLSTACVLIFSLPSLVLLFFEPSTKNLRYSLFLTSLAFFLFSYHVHEKTILIPAISAMLLAPEFPDEVMWFLNLSNASMFSLCVKDNNAKLWLLFVSFFVATPLLASNRKEAHGKSLVSNRQQQISSAIGLGICLLEVFGPVPIRFPHIYQQLTAVFCCSQFLVFLTLFSFQMALDDFALARQRLKSKPKTD